MDLIDIAKSFGLPVAILVATGYACWRIVKWLAAKFLEPMFQRIFLWFDKQIVFLDALDKRLAEQCESLKRISDSQAAQMQTMAQQSQTTQALTACVERLEQERHDAKGTRP